ncbi:MAG: leucine-rich repeat domain-containing protein, partial [Lachnospiraceae bacterium]|nr:leucine-rich repeat domain-containing protein [Lachnospiraceae bacterium]
MKGKISMRKSRILAYLLTACMAVTTPVQALAYEGVAEDITVMAEESSAEETLASEGVTEETGVSLSETLAEGGGTSDAETGTEVKASDETVAAETVAEVKTSDETVAAETETEVSVSNESAAAEAETEETEETQESETEDTAEAAAVSDTDEEEVIPDVEGMLAEVGALEAAGESVYTAVVSADGTVDQQDVDSGTTVVYIPKTAKRIADQAFKGDSNHKTNYDIEEIVFQSGSAITAIGSEAFCNNSLKGVTIPPTVKFIGSKAFDGNRDLSTVSVNSLVMNLDSESEEIFRNCSISQVKWVDGLTMVPDFLFDGAGFDSGYVADFSDSDITEIGTYAYYNSNLGYVDLTGVVEIDPYAFAKKESNTVDSIATLTLPESLMYLGEGAFAFNSKLTTLDIQSCKIQSNTAGNMFYMCKLQTVTWPANIKTIPGGLFKNAYFDKDIELVMLLPSTVREIGPEAFSIYGVTKYDFDKVVIPEDSELRTIGDHAFYGRTSLYDINLDAAVSLKTIGAYAFYNVPLSGELKLNGIVSIGDFAFYSTGSYYFNSVILGPYLKTLGKQLFGNDAKKIGTVKIYSSQLPESLDNFSNSFKGHTGKLPVFNMNENCAVYKKFKAADTDYAFNMKGGCNTIEHSITYTLNNGKWGTEKGQTKYYEGFVYTFEEPVLNGVKFQGWKLGTVVGSYTEKEITNGVYVDRTETNWYKNVKLTAVYSSTPCFVGRIDLRGFADSALVPTVHGNTILLSDSTVASAKAAEKVITAYAYPYDTDGDLMNTKQVELTWKSSDTGVVKVNKTKDFTNTFTLTGETGTARLYVYAKGYGGLEIWSNYVTITVRTMTPTLSYTSLEINKYETMTWVPLVENTTEVVSEDRKGNETTIVKVTDSKGNYQEDQDLLLFPYGSGWYVSLTDPSKYEKETTKKELYLCVVTRYGTTYNDPVFIGPFSLKITVTPPAVTLSSSPTYKGNPFYANEEDAKLVYDIGGTCVVTRVLASAPQNASYPCPWGKDIDGSDYNELELDSTGTSLIMKPYLINSYGGWQSKGNWDNFMLWMKQKVVLTIYGMNSDGEEFVFEKTITPSVSAAKAPKYTLDELTVFDRDGENAWDGYRKMVLRNEYGDIIDNDLLKYEFPISPSTSNPKGFIVTSDGYLNLKDTETTFKSGSLKIRITSPLWTQPLDVTQKISSTVEDDPDTL